MKFQTLTFYILLLYSTLITLIHQTYQQELCSISENQDTLVPTENLERFHSKLFEECCELCLQIDKCHGYTWNEYKNGTCYLKAKLGPLVKKKGVKVGKVERDDVLISWTEFKNAVNYTNYTEPTFPQYESFLLGLSNGSISTKQEAAMAITHFLWESDGLKAKREYKCVDTGCPGSYETPGCDVEEQNYYGRGYIQLTWCFNYKAASFALFGDDRLVEDPDLVAQDEATAWNTAFWFWNENVHRRRGVSEGKFGVTTKAINGGWECAGPHKDVARHRYEMYKKVRVAFGLDGNGDESGCYN